MNFDILTGSRFVTDLGLTLLHSFWQIGLVALGLFIALQILRNVSTQVRYLVSVTALAASLLLPVITFVQIASQPTVSESISAAGIPRTPLLQGLLRLRQPALLLGKEISPRALRVRASLA